MIQLDSCCERHPYQELSSTGILETGHFLKQLEEIRNRLALSSPWKGTFLMRRYAHKLEMSLIRREGGNTEGYYEVLQEVLETNIQRQMRSSVSGEDWHHFHSHRESFSNILPRECLFSITLGMVSFGPPQSCF